MKALLGNLGWVLGTEGPHIDPADKTFLYVFCQQCFLVVKPIVKNGVKTSVTSAPVLLYLFQSFN